MNAAWAFLPAAGSPLAHAPVLTFDRLERLKRPISARAFGANKTWRGALVMAAGATAAAVVLHRCDWYRRRLPPELLDAGPLPHGLLLGTAMVVGELPNSYAKRRLGIPPGGQRRDATGIAISLFDQGDWVPMAWLLLAPFWRMTPREAAQVFALVTVIHLPVNVVGYAIGARTSPI
jgi:hypothetical protein